MPTYEYRCKSCDQTIEVNQGFHDPALTECPSCGGPLRKVFGNIAITFKGSGFYKTDSRSGSKSSTNGAGKAKESASSSSSDGADSAKGAGATNGSTSTNGSSGGKESGAATKKKSTSTTGD